MVEILEFALQDIGVYQIRVGETWRTTVNFKYVTQEDITITLRACPYRYIVSLLDRIGFCCNVTYINLSKTLTPLLKEASIDILFLPEAQGGIADGTYGLIVEILGTDTEIRIDDCLIVGGNPAGVLDILGMVGPLLVLGLMVAIIPKGNAE